MSWPVCLVHRQWNTEDLRAVSWIMCDKTVSQDFRWYWVANEIWLSQTLIIAAILIMKSKTFVIRTLILALLIVSIIDIVNYWFWFRRNEWMLDLEGLVMIVATVIIYNKNVRNNHNEKAA